MRRTGIICSEGRRTVAIGLMLCPGLLDQSCRNVGKFLGFASIGVSTPSNGRHTGCKPRERNELSRCVFRYPRAGRGRRFSGRRAGVSRHLLRGSLGDPGFDVLFAGHDSASEFECPRPLSPVTPIAQRGEWHAGPFSHLVEHQKSTHAFSRPLILLQP